MNKYLGVVRKLILSAINRCRSIALLTLIFSSAANAAVLEFDAAAETVDEGVGVYTFIVTRSAAGGASSVDYTISGSAIAGSDYTGATTGTLFWGVSDGSNKTFSIPINDDSLVEPNETIIITLSDPTGGDTLGTFNPKTLTINDNEDPLQFSAENYAVNETARTVLVTVDRPNNTKAGVSVDYATVAGTASAGTDFTATSGRVSWGAGEATPSKSFSVAITDDTLFEGSETFSVVLSNPLNGGSLGTPSTAVITITSGDPAPEPEPEPESVEQSRDISEIQNLSDNQLSTAAAIDNECSSFDANPPTSSTGEDFKALCDRLSDINTTDAQVKAALDAIIPEELTKMGAVSRQIGGLQHQNIKSRFGVLHRGGGGGIELSGLNLNIDGQEIQGAALGSMLESYLGGVASGDDISRWGLFANGNLKFGDKDATDSNGGYDFDMLALTIGLDYRFSNDFVMGASIGYGIANIDYSDDAGSMDTASLSGTVYASYYLSKNWYIDGLVNYGQDSYDSKRRILYTDSSGTIDRTASGDSDGDQLSFGIISGYDFHAGAWVFGPHFSSYYLNVNVGKLEETGAEAWNTIVSSNQSQSFTVSGGAHVSYTFTPSWGVISPYARFDLVHELNDDPETLYMRLAVSSYIIPISADKLESNYANLGLGITAQFKYGLSGFVDYQTTAGYKGFTINDVSVGMRLERPF
jgi:outer membrane autotransporter protein